MGNYPRTFILFGKSGSGKGTQANLLIEKIKKEGREALYIETGERFREFAEKDNFTAKKTKETMSTGGLLPDFLPIWLWSQILVDEFSGQEDLVLDGLCRRSSEAPILDSALKFYKRLLPIVILINVSDGWATERLMARGRSDDGYIKGRLDWFNWNVIPSMSFFKESSDYRFIEINGEQTIEEVHNDVMKALDAGFSGVGQE